jgi:hypothetical protein
VISPAAAEWLSWGLGAWGGRGPLGNGRVRVNERQALRRPVGVGQYKRSGGGEEEPRKADGWRARTWRREAGVERAGAPSHAVPSPLLSCRGGETKGLFSW